MTSNIDLAPTFEDLAGVRSPAYRSGRSLVETFADPRAQVHEVVFFEHTAYASARLDPDTARDRVRAHITGYYAATGLSAE